MYLRNPQFTGTFYPDNPQVLKKMIEGFLRQAIIPKLKVQPKALIVPHAGYIYSGPIAAYGYKAIHPFFYKTVILLGPSHNFYVEGFVASPFEKWFTPLKETESLTLKDFSLLKNNNLIKESGEVHQLEHSLEVQLPFLQIVLKDFTIFPILVGEVDILKGAEILDYFLDKETLLIISSDLSHYLKYEEAIKQDKVTIDAILDLDLERFLEYGDACGKVPIALLIALAKKHNLKAKLLKASNSGETAGFKDQVVGYASIVFY
jgi:AmmeMemoRadiSam system protein B